MKLSRSMLYLSGRPPMGKYGAPVRRKIRDPDPHAGKSGIFGKSGICPGRSGLQNLSHDVPRPPDIDFAVTNGRFGGPASFFLKFQKKSGVWFLDPIFSSVQ